MDFSKYLSFYRGISKKFWVIVNFILGYLGISISILLIYIFLNKGVTAADIINIFVLGSYLIAPIIVIWAYSDWKEEFRLRQEYKELMKLEKSIIDISNNISKLNNYIQTDWDIRLNNFFNSQNLYGNTVLEKEKIFFSETYKYRRKVLTDYSATLSECKGALHQHAIEFQNDIVTFFLIDSKLIQLETFISKYNETQAKIIISYVTAGISSDEQYLLPICLKNQHADFNQYLKQEKSKVDVDLKEFIKTNEQVLANIKNRKTSLLS